MKLRIQARAKINWTLDVVGTLPNGYHDLDMLMQSVTLCDQMIIEEAPELSLFVRTHGRAFVPADGNNLVLRAAAEALSAHAPGDTLLEIPTLTGSSARLVQKLIPAEPTPPLVHAVLDLTEF